MMSNAALLAPVGLALSWMLTYLIHSTILILSVWLICRGIKPLAKRIGPGGENLAWKLAIVGGFVTASVQIAAGVTPALGAVEISTAPAIVQAPALPPQAPAHTVIHLEHDEPIMLGVGPTSGTSIAPLAPSSSTSSPSTADSPAAPVWPLIVLGVWILGMLIASARLLLSVRGLRQRLADREEVIVDPVLETFLTLCRDAEVKRKIRLTQSSRIGSPIALWRHEVVIPERAVDELSPPAMRSVLAHELAHLERRDPHWLAFAAVLEALCFFQPLNRLARRGMQESAELLCDDWAIAHTGDAVQFAKSLAELASWTNANRSSLLVAGMLSGERPLVHRVRRALDGDPRRFSAEQGPRPTRMLVGLGTLAALIVVAPGAVNASPPKSADQQDDTKESKAERKARKSRDKAEKDALKAEARARKAQLEAEKAEREAEKARLEAEQARRAAQRAAGGPIAGNGQAHGAQQLIIRDGKEYIIVDEHGVQLHSNGADVVIIDGDEPRVQMRIHDGQGNVDLDLDLNLRTLENIGDALGGLLGEGLGMGMEDMLQQGGLGGFGSLDQLQELEALGEMLGGQLERELMQNVDLEALQRDAERQMREAEQQMREAEQQRHQHEQRRREHEHPGQPPLPVTPQMAPPAPPAPPAPLIEI